MMQNDLKTSNGVALVQILVMALTLTAMVMFIVAGAKNQTKLASLANDKTQAYINTHDKLNLLLFELFTEPRFQYSQPETPPLQATLAQTWNFYAEPFIFQGSEFILQDLNGQFSLAFPTELQLVSMLERIEPDPLKVRLIVDKLLDWQDENSISRSSGAEQNAYQNGIVVRNAPIQYVDELANVGPEISASLLDFFRANTSVYKKGPLSIYNAPAAVLQLYFDPDIVDIVLSLRRNKQMSFKKFKEVTGFVEDDKTMYYTSNRLSVAVTSYVGDARYSANMKWVLNINAETPLEPINYLEYNH